MANPAAPEVDTDPTSSRRRMQESGSLPLGGRCTGKFVELDTYDPELIAPRSYELNKSEAGPPAQAFVRIWQDSRALPYSEAHLNLSCPYTLACDTDTTVAFQVDVRMLALVNLCQYCTARLHRHGAMATQPCRPRTIALVGEDNTVEYITPMQYELAMQHPED